MKIVTKISEVREEVRKWRKDGQSVGLVPTMGYLHEGHESLMVKAAGENDRVVASIFVNPMQFGPKEDLEGYPRDLEHDAQVCERAGVDLVFHPSPEEMYGKGFCSFVDMNGLTKELCGKSRPTHFRGVCTVVNKLFHIVTPDRAYFGEKDAQQLAVIRRMVLDLNMEIEIVGCPIVREADGLAKSSRNTYLTPEQRKQAVILSKAVAKAKELFDAGERRSGVIVENLSSLISTMPEAKIDYIQVVDTLSMEPLDVIDQEALVAMAVWFGKARLIDNITLRVGA